MRRDGFAQLRQPHHRGILVVAVQHGICRLAPHVFRAGIIGKTLPEIDGILLPCKRRHDFEYRGRQTREKMIHRLDPARLRRIAF